MIALSASGVRPVLHIHIDAGSILKHADSIFTQIVTDQHLHCSILDLMVDESSTAIAPS